MPIRKTAPTCIAQSRGTQAGRRQRRGGGQRPRSGACSHLQRLARQIGCAGPGCQSRRGADRDHLPAQRLPWRRHGYLPFNWFETVARHADISLCIFQFPVNSGLGYSTETLVRLASPPQVVAIKEGSGSPRVYEANLLALREAAPRVPVLTSNNDWWLGDLAYGGDGMLSESSPVMPELQVALWRAMQNSDLEAARAAQSRIRPLLDAFYSFPDINMHNPMKSALVIIGVLPNGSMRPPLQSLENDEVSSALKSAGLL